jgi:UTP:GlnB (protein PII) uridylyltransferase
VCAVADDRDDAVAFLCAAMMATGLSVTTALAYQRDTTEGREILATFVVVPTDPSIVPAAVEVEDALSRLVSQLVAGELTVEFLLRHHAQTLRPGPSVPTEVELDVREDGSCWMRVTTLDRPGILAAITEALSQWRVLARHVQVTTIADIAVDQFSLHGPGGRPLEPAQHDAVRQAVYEAVEAVHRALC